MSRLRPRPRHERDESGVSLIEVMVSMIVFALAASGVVALLLTSLTTSRQNRQRVQAAQVAAKEISNLRNAVKRGVTIPTGQATVTNSTFQGTTYTTTTTAQWTSLGQQGDACSGNLTGTVAYQRLHTVVTWSTMGSTKPVVSDSIITPQAGTLTNNAINIPMRILGGSSQGQQGLTVTLTWGNGTVTTGTTDSSGCVVFGQLPPAVYLMRINTSGFVDRDGIQNHTQNVGQTIAGTVPLTTVFYDRPGTLVLSPTASFTMPTAYQMSAGQSSWTTNPTAFAGNGTNTVATQVFPFTSATGSAYSAWTGNCNDSQQSPPSVFVGTGDTKTLSVPFANLVGAFTYTKNGTTSYANGLSVTATSAATGCSTAYTWPTTLTPAGNGVMSFSLPYGTYKFSVVVSSVTYRSASISVTPSTTSIAAAMS